MKTRIIFDESSKGFLFVLVLLQLIFTDGILLFGGMILFFYLFYNLQQPYKPSIFTIILVYHFIQISAAVWQSNSLGVGVNYRTPNNSTAIIVSYIGLLAIFLPIIYFQNKIPKLSFQNLKEHANKLSIRKTFRAYIISLFVINLLAGVAVLVPSLRQIIYSLGNIKWFLFLLFGFQSIFKKEMQKEFYIMCAVEFGLGFLSYFSDFKTVLFFVSILLLTLMSYFKFSRFILIVPSLIAVFYGGIFWTSIKSDYRSFLNKGSKTQSVQVDKSEALNKLIELSKNTDESSFEGAKNGFFDRLQYTYHFAKTIDRVPSVIPYQEGSNLGSTLSFVLTPRILSPNKGVYDASIRASKYTGIQYYGAKRGTSVSLGYFADCYIDFGFIGMFIPLLIFGFIYGKSYFYFIRKSSINYIFNFSVVGAIYMELFAFESDSIFVFGRLYINLMVFLLLKIFLFPKLYNYLKVQENGLVVAS
jgi:hypothetical protein